MSLRFHMTIRRLFDILPFIFLFLFLPLTLSSANLGGNTAFFIVCLANFKLLIFTFHKGPLSSNNNISNSISLRVSSRLPRLISRSLNIGFVMVTASWLFFPPSLA
ncbi:probable long-chain-alcohol O-fatty-acyltransferase 4 [Ziziphus jujuba]|uniref:Probable long-chain-alcohol O-fatty-acyltransferase 4 n=1 Tax=Ziziphus jujuba TaxID=326968 RepID=A0ABM3I3S9_ZIZJJ|nr:probable long-chain-alcohol O-fatty-acyltransferase 4 [Ziziphus jujuba]